MAAAITFDDLEEIFNAFRKKGSELEETPIGEIAEANGGFLILSKTNDGGTLSLHQKRPAKSDEYFLSQVAKAVVGRHDANFQFCQDIHRYSSETKRMVIAIYSYFEYIQRKNGIAVA